MVRPAPFEILYAPVVKDHLSAIERKYHSLIQHEINERLTWEPATETRNRKPLLREVEFEADWELRFGPNNRFRVFYAVELELRQVQIVAIGVKRGSSLFIGGEEIKL